MRWFAFLLLLGGCDLVFGLTGGLPTDAAAPGETPTVDARQCFGTGLFQACWIDPPVALFEVADGSTVGLNTDTSPSCARYTGADLKPCVVIADRVSIRGHLRATGSRPLVLLATSTLTVTSGGNVDVSSSLLIGGAGESPILDCNPTTGAQGNAGGAGGSFAGRGGGGGMGSVGTLAVSGPLLDLTTLHGGCKGSNGSSTTGSSSGHGGGAVYLIAGDTIAISGIVNASGGGGKGGDGSGGTAGGGGGGGGAGGMIGLDAPHFAIDGQIFANGGGGGEGGSGGVAGSPAGANGKDPSAPNAATGGGGTTNGGDGGDGARGVNLAGTNGGQSTNMGGGGAGGGGAGLIRVFPAQNPGGVISPPPT